MESIARILVASTDLIEAEGRALKNQAAKIFMAAGIGIVALVMALAGLGFVLYGLFALLARYIQPFGAALVFGAVALGVAFAAIVMAKKLFR